jgi:ATP-dependent exoDNAse (exonuclease V) beta subunit
LGGWAELRHAEDEAGRFAATLAILLETQAQDRNLSVAVLVQRNETAAKLADFLRQEGGLRAVAESDLHVATDNPLTCALLALLQAAAHPGDRFAREHLRMTPLWTALEEAGLTTEDALTGQILQELHATGLAGTLARWLGRLEPDLATGDEFSRRRGRQLVELARLFDEDGRRDVAEFLAVARAHAARDAEAANAIRVMTIHKAKGLGFDLVILPDLEGRKLAQRREGLAIHRAADRAVEWILDLPSAPFAAGDPILAAQIADEEADAAYEALCLLYVAMTRAKRAMYLVTQPVGEKSISRNYPKLLEQTLGNIWSEGDPTWFASLPLTREGGAGEGPPGLEPLAGAAGAARLVARRPSGEQRGAVGGALLFSLENARGAERGTAVHALLAEVEWAEPGVVEKLAAAWRTRNEDAAAVAEALACLRSPGLAEVWTKPPGPVGLHEVWRERRFETVLDGVWITGTFDRVVVARDAQGRAKRATVFDFKTDATPDPTRHRSQLALYRQAAKQLTGLAEGAVGAELVFTSTRTRAGAATGT